MHFGCRGSSLTSTKPCPHCSTTLLTLLGPVDFHERFCNAPCRTVSLLRFLRLAEVGIKETISTCFQQANVPNSRSSRFVRRYVARRVLRSHVGVGSDCPDDVNNTDPCNSTKVSVEPAKNSKFITPEITEEKYYNRDTGLFMIHKLTSQEAEYQGQDRAWDQEPKANLKKLGKARRGNGTSAAAAKDGGLER